MLARRDRPGGVFGPFAAAIDGWQLAARLAGLPMPSGSRVLCARSPRARCALLGRQPRLPALFFPSGSALEDAPTADDIYHLRGLFGERHVELEAT